VRAREAGGAPRRHFRAERTSATTRAATSAATTSSPGGARRHPSTKTSGLAISRSGPAGAARVALQRAAHRGCKENRRAAVLVRARPVR
jgi:hypothetical protein